MFKAIEMKRMTPEKNNENRQEISAIKKIIAEMINLSSFLHSYLNELSFLQAHRYRYTIHIHLSQPVWKNRVRLSILSKSLVSTVPSNTETNDTNHTENPSGVIQPRTKRIEIDLSRKVEVLSSNLVLALKSNSMYPQFLLNLSH